ncbi:right-handed parallel beta-helix repeat-containing protein [Microbacterium sp. NPDC076768]|uniref:right-handed parallel beta-helix repeat-containing protein n=1 Tax=Microbacterium sp. NPDC076768 TaxID=3154858 RepID=UPI0034264719
MPASAVADASTTRPQAVPTTPDPYLNDDMSRTVANGWGASATGTWEIVEGSARVSSGQAMLASRAPGITARATVDGVAAADVSSTFSLVIPTLPEGGSLYLTQAVRVAGKAAYGVRVRLQPDGAAYLSVVRLTDLTSVQQFSERKLPLTVKSGTALSVAFEAEGSSPVSLNAKAWASGSTEPSEWQVTHEDSSQERIQSAGGYAFSLYTSSGAKDAVSVGIDNVIVSAAGDGSVAAPAPDPDPATVPEVDPEPAPGVEPELPGTTDGVRGDPGARAPGALTYPAPATAVYVASTGSDRATGTKNAPLRSIAAALRVVPNGGTIVLRGGTYHEEVVIPTQKKVTIQPAPNEAVWLDGAKKVTGWKASGNTWVVDGWNPALDSSPTYSKGAPDNAKVEWRFVDPDYPMASHPDQVWIGGVQLKEVAAKSEVKAGAFYVDDQAKRLIIGTDPTGKSVEASVLTQALSIRSAGTEIRGIGVRRYATSVPEMGTVVAAAANVTLTDVTIRDNSTTGFYSWSAGTTLNRVSLIGNGMLGGGASQANNLTIDQMLSVGNNTERFNHSPVSGAFKVTRATDVSVTNSAFTDNYGRGPWFDESVVNLDFTGNDVIGNAGHGLLVELSENAVVADNVIARNGDFGLFVLGSGNVKIWNNTFVGNGNRNVNISMDDRRASDPAASGYDPKASLNPAATWVSRKIVMSNNVIAESAGSCMVCVQDFSLTYTGAQMISSMDGNLYHRTSAGTPRWFSAWSRGAVSRDPAVADTLAAFTGATGHDKRSKFVEGTSVVDSSFVLKSEQAAGQGSIALRVPSDVASVSRLSANSAALGALPR